MNSILLFSNRKKIIKIESWTKNYLYSPPKKNSLLRTDSRPRAFSIKSVDNSSRTGKWRENLGFSIEKLDN